MLDHYCPNVYNDWQTLYLIIFVQTEDECTRVQRLIKWHLK